MKYGRLVHIGFAKKDNSENRLMSLGDMFECLAIEKIYERLEINKEDILDCNQYEVMQYNGEYIVLPINIYSLNVRYSKRILPVFLGLTIGGTHDLSSEEINTLRRFSPVGCRDERTMHRLLDLGIDAYFQGCLVATFPKRVKNEKTQNKVFFVNPEAGIKPYIPKELLDNYEFFSHDFYSTVEEVTNGTSIYEYAQKAIDMYSNEARLIVTSKFHAAIIALALGIPVILVMENCYYKYSWIKKYIPVYEPKDYGNIDWNPKPICIPDSEKELMLNIACDRIKYTYNKYKDICTLSEIRESTGELNFQDIFYGNYAIEYIKNNWKTDEKIEYAFWGATETAVVLYKYISEKYPNAKLKKVYDFAIKNEFLNHSPESPDNIKKEDNYFILVTGNSASEAAKSLFTELGIPQNSFFCCERKILKKEDIN